MKLGCGTVVFRHFSLETALRQIRAAGYLWIETQATMPFCGHVNPWQDDPLRYRHRVQEHGFLGTTALWAADGSLIPNKNSVDAICTCLEWAKAAGIPIVHFGDGFKSDDLSREQAWDVLRRRLHVIVEKARALGVQLAIEPHGTFSLTRQGLLDILALEPAPLGVNYDAANIYRGGYVETQDIASVRSQDIVSVRWREIRARENEVDVARAIASRVVHVHVKDYDRNAKRCLPLGQGGVRNAQVLRVLLDSGYDGPLSLETEGHEDLDTCQHVIKASKRYLDRLLPELGVSLEDALPSQ